MPIHDPTSYADLSQGRIQHIDFHIRMDFSTNTLAIRATYRLDAPRRGPLFLDAFKIDLQKAHVNGRALVWEFDTQNDVLGSRLHLKGLSGDSTFTLEFRTSPDARALQWLNAAQTLSGRHPFLYSQCQATNARSVFPCQDTPSVRFTFAAEVEAPKELTVVMAAKQVEGQKGSGHFVFRMPQPIPSYLFALAAGNLEFRELGPRTGIYAEPQIIESAVWEFAENEKKIVEAEKLLGPYLWGRYDLLVLPPSFPFGGMENPRLTFLTPTAILGTRGQTYLITHELAHAWTGNLVTNATMNDFWLNEGFTVWAERRILEVLKGREGAVLAWALGQRALERAMERFGAASPYTRLKTDLWGVDPDSVYSEVPYEKGARFVALLERTAGREVFDRFIREYIARFRFTSITTEEFLAFLEERLPGLAARAGAEEWLYRSGLPANAPRFASERMAHVEALASKWGGGQILCADEVRALDPDETLLFLQNLPRPLPADSLKALDGLLGLTDRGNYEILVEWLTIAARSDYEPAFAKVEEVLSRVGRMKFVRPLFKALGATERTRALARRIFEANRAKYHTLTRRVAEAEMAAYAEG